MKEKEEILKEIIEHCEGRLSGMDEKSVNWDKYIYRMSAQEAYEDILELVEKELRKIKFVV